MARIAVVHYIGATERSRSVVSSILADLTEEGHELHLVDITDFSVISQDLPGKFIARALGHRVFENAFDNAVCSLGVRHLRLGLTPHGQSRPEPERWESVRNAIDSELLTYFRRPSLNEKNFAIRSMRKKLTAMALATYASLSELFDELQPSLVLVPNGRTSRQKVTRIAAEERGVAVNFYENGRASANSYYLGTTQPHDRVASQKEVDQLVAHLNEEETHQMAHRWLRERMSPSSGTNSFSSLWSPQAKPGGEESPGSQKSAVFFTSSADEYLAFGPMWNIDEWESQFHAFDLIMSLLELDNVRLRLRVHPNLTRKSRKYFKETVNSLRELNRRHPSLQIDWPNSSVNSYELTAAADYVVAERSTIGLEANLMGKPVWINQASQWDLTADVRQLLKPADVSRPGLTAWKVDSSGGEKFVAYWMLQEKPLRFSWQDWSTWSPEAAPARMKLALLGVKNPWSHRLHLLRLEWDRVRNARFMKPKG